MEDNIKEDLEGEVCKRVHWIQLAQDRIQSGVLVNTVTELGSMKGRQFLNWLREQAISF
jgi:hypothetical protein